MEYRHVIESSEELGRWYDGKYLEMGDGWNTPAEECHRHLDDLGVPFDKTRRLLDVGCGAGHFLAEAQKRVQCVGLELSQAGIEYAAKRGVACVRKQSIEDADMAERFDYIVSIGSLEHIVDLDRALDNIRRLLTPSGKFYFYCPNELWKHFDQPNERTMPDSEWITLFVSHGLYVHTKKRWNDNTAFIGGKSINDVSGVLPVVLPPRGNKLNCGSGQRPFDQQQGWVNIDIQNKYQPDLVADWNDLGMFADGSMEFVVSHHSLEHVGCGEGDGFIREAHRVLKPGGSLLVFVPNMKALAQRWLTGQIDDYTYFVNVYGAYMGNASDRHAWGYSPASLHEYLSKWSWSRVKQFDWRTVAGASLARDWWVLAMEAVK